MLNIDLAPTWFGAAGTPCSGSPKDNEIVHMLRHKGRISEGKEWIPSVCCQSQEPSVNGGLCSGGCCSLIREPNLGSLIEKQKPPEHNPPFTLGSCD
jgi:hypothetical protein